MASASTNSSAPRIPRAALIVAAVVCSSTVVSHVFGRATYSILLPAISEDLVSSYTGAGFLGAANFAGYMTGVIVVTMLAGRSEPVVLLRAGLGLAAVALVLLAVAPTFATLSFGILLIGFAGAGIWITAPTIATAGVPEQRRGAVLGALTASMGLSLLAVSQGTTAYRRLVDDESAWRPVFAIEAVIAILIFGAAFAMIRPQSTRRTHTGGVGFSTAELRSIPHWQLLTLGYALFSTLAGTWSQFLGLALEKDAGFDRTHVNNLYSVLAVAGIAGPLIFGRLSDRIGRDITIAAAALVTAAASALLTVGTEPWTSFAVALFGFGSYSVPVLTAAAVRDHLSDRAFATAYGTMTILYGAGSLMAAQFGGVLADRTGSFDGVYWLLAFTATLAGLTAAGRRLVMGRPAHR